MPGPGFSSVILKPMLRLPASLPLLPKNRTKDPSGQSPVSSGCPTPLPPLASRAAQYLVWVRGPTGRSGLLGGSAPGLLRELVLGGRGFLGGMAGTEGFCKSSFGSLSGLSLRKHKEDRENSCKGQYRRLCASCLKKKTKQNTDAVCQGEDGSKEHHLFLVKLEKVLENHRPLLAFTHAGPSGRGSFQSCPALENSHSHFTGPTHIFPGCNVTPSCSLLNSWTHPQRHTFLLLPFLSHEGQPFINKLHLNTFWVSVCLAQPAGCQPPRASV